MTAAERLAAAGVEYEVLTRVAERARLELTEAIRAAIAGGMTEVEAARVAGVSRPTIRKALGK